MNHSFSSILVAVGACLLMATAALAQKKNTPAPVKPAQEKAGGKVKPKAGIIVKDTLPPVINVKDTLPPIITWRQRVKPATAAKVLAEVKAKMGTEAADRLARAQSFKAFTKLLKKTSKACQKCSEVKALALRLQSSPPKPKRQ